MELQKDSFWEQLQDVYPEIIQTITNMSKKTYVSVTNVETGITWWSDHAVEFFGLKDNLAVMTKEDVKATIHPDDKEYYRRAFSDKIKGINIEEPIEYRVQTRKDHYDRFTASCRAIKNKAGEIQFIITNYDNHGIADEVDAITGLHTEPTLMRDLKDFIDRHIPATVIKIGLNQFSNINVLYGAEYSDAILHKIASVLIEYKTDKGYAYRMQGAKFAIAYESITFYELREIYNKIVDVLTDNIIIEGKRVPLKISGGAVRLEAYMQEPNAIRSRMTYALNQSRYQQHGELVIFNDTINDDHTDKLKLVSIIHQDAVDKREGFFLCYQPIVDCLSGEIKGMEALIRWKQEPYGVVPPYVFIDWLEEDACIFDLGNWIIETALADCKKVAGDNKEFFVNVNVCPAQLERKEFRDQVMGLLNKSGLEPNQLCIELTERCRNLDVNFLKAEAAFFKKQGIRVALDDFGTGTSSLSVVLDLPLDEVKIDMSFIRDIQNKPLNQAMVKSIVEFANRMELETCIEGVENEEVRDHLQRYEAKWFQGYLYSKPVPIDEFMKLV